MLEHSHLDPDRVNVRGPAFDAAILAHGTAGHGWRAPRRMAGACPPPDRSRENPIDNLRNHARHLGALYGLKAQFIQF